MARHPNAIKARLFIERMVNKGLIVSLDGKIYHLTEKGREVAAAYREKEAA